MSPYVLLLPGSNESLAGTAALFEVIKCFRREPWYRPTSEFHVNLLSTDSKIPRASRPSSGRLARFFLFLQVFISRLPVQGLRNKPAIRVKLSGGKPIATLS